MSGVPDPDLVIDVHQATVTRGGKDLIRAVDWRVELDERWVVLGPNGAGKTTLLNLAAARLHPSSGTVDVLGERLGVEQLSAHDGRHTWATLAIKAGTDLKALQDAGGWKSPYMPLRYAEAAKIANDGVKLPE